MHGSCEGKMISEGAGRCGVRLKRRSAVEVKAGVGQGKSTGQRRSTRKTPLAPSCRRVSSDQ